ncbi:MAG: hypothetical protein JSW71_04910 [Gemmatimonadota bacterium]|nr:MAG: hypothetical protein JSW71_04910 [Gemmatimonadota bacterium]
MPEGPNPQAVGVVAAEHMGPLLYALELCALSMDRAGRSEDAAYYRLLARKLAEAGGTPPDADGCSGASP